MSYDKLVSRKQKKRYLDLRICCHPESVLQIRNTQTKLTLENIIYNLSKPDLNDIVNKKENKPNFQRLVKLQYNKTSTLISK